MKCFGEEHSQFFFPKELIGKKIKIIAAKNQSNLGFEGVVIDETRSTLKIEQEGKVKILLKDGITLKLFPTGEIIQGVNIKKKPEERLKGN